LFLDVLHRPADSEFLNGSISLVFLEIAIQEVGPDETMPRPDWKNKPGPGLKQDTSVLFLFGVDHRDARAVVFGAYGDCNRTL
jgi:hypothetical protein